MKTIKDGRAKGTDRPEGRNLEKCVQFENIKILF